VVKKDSISQFCDKISFAHEILAIFGQKMARIGEIKVKTTKT